MPTILQELLRFEGSDCSNAGGTDKSKLVEQLYADALEARQYM